MRYFLFLFALFFANHTLFAQGGTPSAWFDSKLDIVVEGNGFADVTYVFYNDSATLGFDPIYDRYKNYSAFGQPTLFTEQEGPEMLSYNGRNNMDLGLPVPLGLAPGADGSFTLSFAGQSSFDSTTLLYLEDLQLGVWHNIRDTSYTFSMLTTDSTNRFMLHFTEPFMAEAEDGNCLDTNGTITVYLGIDSLQGGPLEWSVSVMEASSGSLLSSHADTFGLLTWDDVQPGSYVLEYAVGSYTTSQTVEIDAPLPPTALFSLPSDSVFVGDTVALTASAAEAWEWQVNGQVVSTDSIFLFVPDTSDVFTIDLMVSGDSCSDTFSDSLRVFPSKQSDDTTAIGSVSQLPLAVRSSRQGFYIHGLHQIEQPAIVVYVMDIQGKQLMTKRLLTQHDEYFLEVLAPAGFYVVKLVADSAFGFYPIQLTR